MDMEYTNGQMVVYIKETGIKTRFQNTVNIIGMTVGHIKDTG